MELREKNLILFLIILITDYCYKPKLTEAFLPDSATAGSRERRFVVNERLRISEVGLNNTNLFFYSLFIIIFFSKF